MSERLFQNGRLTISLEAHGQALDREIDQAPEDHALHADEDSWAAALIRRYTVMTPILGEIWMDPPQEVQVDVRYDGRLRAITDMSRPVLVPGTRNIIHIPFDGDADVFKLVPSTSDFSSLEGDLRAHEVIFVVESPNDVETDLAARANEFVTKLDRNLGWARTDIEAFNATLERRARARIQARRERIRQNYERAAASGIPIRAAGGAAKTYIADIIQRRPSPVVPRRLETPIPLEPVLGDAIFDHILEIVGAATLQMERSPESYRPLDEEARRDVILTALNTHYQGQGTAEAFNKQGKTDILVRVDNKNVFIAECKFWSGAKSLTDALDQLFRYAGLARHEARPDHLRREIRPDRDRREGAGSARSTPRVSRLERRRIGNGAARGRRVAWRRRSPRRSECVPRARAYRDLIGLAVSAHACRSGIICASPKPQNNQKTLESQVLPATL